MAMATKTIIYYTSNCEDSHIEKRVQETILKNCGGLPIVSVSQKPIDFGTNICVGDVGACNHNLFRQIQIACEHAKTDFVISCEADCLYPPDYFQFKATDINQCYKFTPIYILNEWGKGEYKGFFEKDIAPLAQVCGRLHYIREIDKVLENLSYWGDKRLPNPPELFKRHRWLEVTAKTPIISLKTYHGLRRHTKTKHKIFNELPYWGDADKLRKEVF